MAFDLRLFFPLCVKKVLVFVVCRFGFLFFCPISDPGVCFPVENKHEVQKKMSRVQKDPGFAARCFGAEEKTAQNNA